MPVDLGSKGSCCNGGNIRTNSVGQYYYRYGLGQCKNEYSRLCKDDTTLDSMRSIKKRNHESGKVLAEAMIPTYHE